MEWILFLLIGAFAGFSAGLLGIGGGLIMVPALSMLLPALGFADDKIMHMAIANSLAAIVPTAMSSAYRHHKHHSIDWFYVRKMVPGLVFGSVLGVGIAIYIARIPLQIIFSLFLLVVSVYLLIGQPLLTPRARISIRMSRVVSVAIGSISALLGVGGGTMTVPFLISQGVVAQVAVGTSAFCGIPIAVTAVMIFAFSSGTEIGSQLGSLIYWPGLMLMILASVVSTPFGANLAHQLSTVKLKRIFAALLIFVAIGLFYDAILHLIR